MIEKYRALSLIGVGALIAGMVAGIARSQTIFVTSGNSIAEVTPDGSVVNPSFITGLQSPYGLAISGNDIFVANSSSGTIGEYTTSGAPVNPSLITGLTAPTALTISGTNLFVTSRAGTVNEYTTTGASVHTPLISGLTTSLSIAVSGNNLFVNNGSTAVDEYTTSGTLVKFTAIQVGALSLAVSGNNLLVGSQIGQGPGGGPNPAIGVYNTSGTPINQSFITLAPSVFPEAMAVSGNYLFVWENLDPFGHNGVLAEYTTSGTLVNPSLYSGTGGYGVVIAAPEPSSSALAAVGACFLFGYFKMRRKENENAQLAAKN